MSSIVSKSGESNWPLPFNAAQLKTIQEVITLVVCCIFSVVYLKEELKWNYLAGFAMMIGAVFAFSRSGSDGNKEKRIREG
ncbi:MAG TPA: DMT family protein [Nitrospiraceae bacterium]|nr:DMT family protein [Nitrospiraceae bacterium]